MKKQTIWLVISYLTVATLLLVSCASAVTEVGEETTQEEKEATPPEEGVVTGEKVLTL